MLAMSLVLALQNPALQPAHRLGEGWWKQRHEACVRLSYAGPLDVAFLGDSITQGWEGAGRQAWNRAFDGLRTGNFGFSGDRTEHVLWRLANEELIPAHPKVIVIMIGTNNVGHGSSNADQTAEGVRAVVGTLRSKLPQAKILLLGIFPRGKEPNDRLRLAVEQANNGFKSLADGRTVRYFDIKDQFLAPDGTLPADIMPDFLHLSPAGYERWANAISGPIRQMLGS